MLAGILSKTFRTPSSTVYIVLWSTPEYDVTKRTTLLEYSTIQGVHLVSPGYKYCFRHSGFVSMEDSVSSVALVVTGATTLVLASALAYVMHLRRSGEVTVEKEAPPPEEDHPQQPGGVVSVYFATQTGTSEAFGKVLEREAADHGFFLRVIDLEDIVLEDLLKNMIDGVARAIFLVATYGEGEAPDNAASFASILSDRSNVTLPLCDETVPANEPDCLQGLEYCVFGLGNRQYEHFNAGGKLFDIALERLGAKRVVPLALGDDDDDIENDFENWKDQKLWPTLRSMYLKDDAIIGGRDPASESNVPCRFKLNICKPTDSPIRYASESEIHAHSRHYFSAVDCPVVAVRELRTELDEGSTKHVEIDLSSVPELSYCTADNLGVLPVNDESIVESVAESLGYDLNDVFSLSPAENQEWHGSPFPMPLSVRECFSRYCDLTGVPRRSDLKILASFATDATDRQALLRLSSKEGRNEYKQKILDEYIGFVDILKLCPSIAMPLEHFLSICPLLQARFFTISSSSVVHPRCVHLTVAVSQSKRSDGSMFHGVCSTYLSKLRPGQDVVRVFNRPSSFRLPADQKKPILMIGPGTGVAPMRALLQERSHQRQSGPVGKNMLYFGCKTEEQDYLYKDEMLDLQSCGDLDVLRVAFSRATKDKVYVQHLLMDDTEMIWDLIDRGGYIYLCGGVKMGQDVVRALTDIVAAQKGVDAVGAKSLLDSLSASGRFVQELWA